MSKLDYQERQEARRERLEARAERLKKESNAAWEKGAKMFDAIPFGQPIMVGHYSEKRDRNYRAKAGAALDKGVALRRQAEEVAARAASVGTGGVSSDDPEAIAKLKEKLANLEAMQAFMKAANVLVRRAVKDGVVDATSEGFDAYMASLEAIKPYVARSTAAALLKPDFAGRVGYADFQLTNNGAEIRRTAKRIQQLEREATRNGAEIEVAGVRIVENVDENRIQVIFPGKPNADTRAVLKSYGFRWAPSQGAWQRMLNNAGVAAAQAVASKLKEISNEA